MLRMMAHWLKKFGCTNIRAFDDKSNKYSFIEYLPIVETDSYDVPLFSAKYCILSWPCDATSFALQVVKKMRSGQVLIYIGEGHGGCTGDDDFHLLIEDTKRFRENTEKSEELNNFFIRFNHVYDHVQVFEKI